VTDANTVAFRHDMVALIDQAGLMGALTSLSASLLRLTTPGVPDIYQGSGAMEPRPGRSRQP